MNINNKPITLDLLLQSLENDFDKHERELLLNDLRNSIPSDEALLGAKLILEQNNWDYRVLKSAFSKAETRIENLATPKTTTSYLKYAAILIPIMAMAGYYFYSTTTNSIAPYYIKEAGLPSMMSAKKTNWDELMQLYRSNQFEKAFALSEKIKVQKPTNDTIHYFQAVIAYDLKKYDIALKGFKKVTQNKESAFYNEAEFRLGFVLKQLKQDQEAKHQFEIVKANSANPYDEDAFKVLKILNSSK